MNKKVNINEQDRRENRARRAPATLPPSSPLPPPFPSGKVFFPSKIGKHNIFACATLVYLWNNP